MQPAELVAMLRSWFPPRRRWGLGVLGTAAATIALLLVLRGIYRQELYHFTGSAQWLWVSGEVREPRPTAGLFFVKVRLHARPLEGVAKVCGDRAYVLWINGQPVMSGRNRPGFHLDVVPVTDLLGGGDNLIAVETRSPTSVGGLLFSLDLVPSGAGRRAGDPRGKNVVVSGPHWKVTGRWSRGFPDALPASGVRPWIWGRPPDHPWGYPTAIRHKEPLAQAMSGEPVVLGPDAFVRGRDGVWRCTLAGPFGGVVWLHGRLSREDGLALRIRWEQGDEGSFLPVVPLEGQESYLVAGRLRGRVVEVRCAGPPPGLRLVPTEDTVLP